MLGRRLLKRLTRLGLATYAMTWCMAFTVCASENPIADLAVANAVETLKYEESAAQERLLPDSEDGFIASGVLSDESEAVIEDSEDILNMEASSEEEVSVLRDDLAVEAAGNDGAVYVPTPLSGIEISAPEVNIFNISKSYNFYINPINMSEPLNGDNISYFLSGNADGSNASDFYNGAKINNNGILNFSSSTESMTFYVVGKYDAGEGQIFNATKKVVVYIPIDSIGMWVFDSNGGFFCDQNFNVSLNASDKNNTQFKLLADPVDESLGYKMDGKRVSWELTDMKGEKFDPARYGINVTLDNEVAHINIENITDSCLFNVTARYNNTFTDASGVNQTYPVDPVIINGIFNVTVYGDVPADDYEAHLSDKALKVGLYKSHNPIAVSVRNFNASSKAEVDDYRITDCRFTNPELNKLLEDGLLELGVLDDGKTININASGSLVNSGKMVSELVKEYKKGLSTGLEVDVKATVDGGLMKSTFNTTENITITFDDALPKAKDIKSVGTLEFDSFKAGMEGLGVKFTGPEVGRIMAPTTDKDKKAYDKAGLTVDSGTCTVNSTKQMPEKGSGKVNVLVFLNDTEYNLPSNYNISVPVSYKITNGAPVLTLDQSSALLNCAPSDFLLVSFGIKGMTSDTLVMCDVKDSKGHAINGTAPITASAFSSGTSGYVYLGANDGIEYGTSYKVEIYPQNVVSGRKGVKKVITVKTPAEKAVQSFTTKQKGTIDAGIPMSAVYLTLSGKNVNLLLKTPVNVTTTLKNGEDISDLLTYYAFPDEKLNPVFILYEKSPFLLLEKGLGGQQYVTKIAYNISGNTITTEYKGKISNSVVTPKLEESRISINPDANFNQTIRIPVTNLPGGEYKYDIKNNSPFGINVTSELARDYVEISTDTISDSAYGKTFEIAITPKAPEKYNATLSAKAATLKIAVLNPKKNAAAMSAQVKGSIDAVRDDTNATAVISFKNIYDSESMIEDIVCKDIVLKGKGKSTPLPCYENFNCTTDGNKVIFTRMPGKNIQAGTYVATVAAFLNNGGHVTGTVEFKVVRGKTNTVVNPATAVLINRDNARYTTVYFSPKKNDANAIINATIVADKNKFDEYFSLEQIKDNPGKYRLRVQKGYYEKQVKKSIVSMITKEVTKNVKVNVYYNGSTEYETVTVKVKIKP